jgi:hypothetical protein
MNVTEKIFCCNSFNEDGHTHVGKNFRPIKQWMINLISTVKQSGKVCAKCRIKFYKMGKTYDPVIYMTIPAQTPMNYKKLSKKSMIHPMKQKMLVLQMLLLKY